MTWNRRETPDTMALMRITMVKKKMRDGSDCRKCGQVTEQLESRGLWEKIDEVVWFIEGDPESPGALLGEKHNMDRAPFFIVRDDDGGEEVYSSVMRLIKDRFGGTVTRREQAKTVDADDVGGI
jgi:hypothetical protein